MSGVIKSNHKVQVFRAQLYKKNILVQTQFHLHIYYLDHGKYIHKENIVHILDTREIITLQAVFRQ